VFEAETIRVKVTCCECGTVNELTVAHVHVATVLHCSHCAHAIGTLETLRLRPAEVKERLLVS
jgi:hypothetical protein